MSLTLAQFLKTSREVHGSTSGSCDNIGNNNRYGRTGNSSNQQHGHYWDWDSSTALSSSTSFPATGTDRRHQNHDHHLVVLAEDAIMLDGNLSGRDTATGTRSSSATTCSSSYWGGVGYSTVSKRKNSHDSVQYNVDECNMSNIPVYDWTTGMEVAPEASNESDRDVFANNERRTEDHDMDNHRKKQHPGKTNTENHLTETEENYDDMVGEVTEADSNFCEGSNDAIVSDDYQKIGLAHHRFRGRNSNETCDDEFDTNHDNDNDGSVHNTDSHSSYDCVVNEQMGMEHFIDEDDDADEYSFNESNDIQSSDYLISDIPTCEAYPVSSFLSYCTHNGCGCARSGNCACNDNQLDMNSFYCHQHQHHRDTMSLEIQGYSRPEFVYSQVIMSSKLEKIGISFAKKRITVPVVGLDKHYWNRQKSKARNTTKKVNVIVISKIDDEGMFGRRNNYCLKPNDIVIAVNNQSVSGKMKASTVAKLLLQGMSKSKPQSETNDFESTDTPSSDTTISIMIRNVGGDPRMYLSSVEKPTSGTMIGIALTNYCTGNPLVVTRVDHDGLFGHSLLSAGQRCLTINGVPCSTMPSQDAVKLIHRRWVHHHHGPYENVGALDDGRNPNVDESDDDDEKEKCDYDDAQYRNVTILSMVPPRLTRDCAMVISSETGRKFWMKVPQIAGRVVAWKRNIIGDRPLFPTTTFRNINNNNDNHGTENSTTTFLRRRRYHVRDDNMPCPRRSPATINTNYSMTTNLENTAATTTPAARIEDINTVAFATLLWSTERR